MTTTKILLSIITISTFFVMNCNTIVSANGTNFDGNMPSLIEEL